MLNKTITLSSSSISTILASHRTLDASYPSTNIPPFLHNTREPIFNSFLKAFLYNITSSLSVSINPKLPFNSIT